MNQEEEKFGALLRNLRIKKGFSQQNVIDIFNNKAKKQGLSPISKSALSLYERSEIKTPDNDIITLLSEIYEFSREQLLFGWFQERYNITTPSTFIEKTSDESFFIKTSNHNHIEVITIENLEQRQSVVSSGAQIWVATTDFLDDDIFFDMVSENIWRGVIYKYLMPHHSLISFNQFRQRLDDHFIKTKEEEEYLSKVNLIEKNTAFIPRLADDFPINYVIHVDHTSDPLIPWKAFVGLVIGDRPQYYQLADDRLVSSLYRSFYSFIFNTKTDSI